MKIYRLLTKYKTRGGGLIKFDLDDSADRLVDCWWDGREVPIQGEFTASYKYSKILPLAISTGNLIVLYREEVVEIIKSFESHIQTLQFEVSDTLGKKYDYHAIKTTQHLEVFDEKESLFGSDGSPKILKLVAPIEENRHYFRITGIKNITCISDDLAAVLMRVNDGSMGIEELPFTAS